MPEEKVTIAGSETLASLDKAGADLVQNLSTILSQTKNFVSDQAPDVIQQYISWGIAKYSMGCFLGLILLISGIWFIRKAFKINDEEAAAGMGIFGFSSTVAGIIITSTNIYSLVQIWIAPKIWLIEQASEIMKGK